MGGGESRFACPAKSETAFHRLASAAIPSPNHVLSLRVGIARATLRIAEIPRLSVAAEGYAGSSHPVPGLAMGCSSLFEGLPVSVCREKGESKRHIAVFDFVEREVLWSIKINILIIIYCHRYPADRHYS